jgi:hypothetical protein
VLASKPRCSSPNSQIDASTSQLWPVSTNATTPRTRIAAPTPADTRAARHTSCERCASSVAGSARWEMCQAQAAGAASAIISISAVQITS